MSRDDQDSRVDELLEQQIAAVVAGAPSEAEGRALNARLRGDRAARRLYIEHLMLHGQLQWELAQPGRVNGGLPVPPARDSGTVSGAESAARRQQRRRANARNRALAAAALAAGVLLAWSLGVFAPGPAARLLETSTAQWDGPAPGRDLRPQRLHLASGLVALRFRDGAKVILQGPAEFEVLGGAAGRLISGRLVGRAPDGAHGFTINAAGMDVVDLGTEFGVAITGARQADVQVFEGVVEVGRPGPAESSDRRRLGIGQAVHVDGAKGTVETAEFAPASFARVMPGELEDPGLDRGLVGWWTFAETSGTVVRDASGHGHYGELVGAGFTMERAGVPGRVGRALAFDGRTTCIKVAHSGDFELNALSIQAWIRPEGAQDGDAQIFSRNRCYGLGVCGNHWFKWYFWDRDALLPWNFATGRWYHLVATFDGAQRECWIDGVKIGSLASNPPPARAGEVMIGTLAGRDNCFFHGAIDDLRVYDRALSSDEIRALYLRGAHPEAP